MVELKKKIKITYPCCEIHQQKKLQEQNKTNKKTGGFFVCVRRLANLILEEQRSHTANFTLLFHKDLKVLVDDGDGQEDSCPRADGSQEVRHDGQPSYTEPSERSGCGDIPAEKQQN